MNDHRHGMTSSWVVNCVGDVFPYHFGDGIEVRGVLKHVSDHITTHLDCHDHHSIPSRYDASNLLKRSSTNRTSSASPATNCTIWVRLRLICAVGRYSDVRVALKKS